MADIRGLKSWMRVLVDQDLPTLASVVQEICELSESDDSCADDLTQIILRDADLTSQVLKIANSVHYNRSPEPINTVSRALVQIGMVELKSITLASTLIDGFLGGKPKQLLIERLAKSFHAAVQARAMVPHLTVAQQEQVFIAALLCQVGELAILATGRPQAEHFICERDLQPDEEHALALEHLGVGIRTLNQALVKDWKLGDLVLKATNKDCSGSQELAAVCRGMEIADKIHKGMDHPEMKQVIGNVALLMRKSNKQAREQIVLMAEESSAIAISYGAERLLPALPKSAQLESGWNTNSQGADTIQRHLNHMHQVVKDGGGISDILQLSVMGLHKACAFQRVTVALLDYPKRRLEPCYVAGKGTESWREKISTPLDRLKKGELLHEFLIVQQAMWYQAGDPEHDLGVMQALTEGGDCMISALKVGKRLLGVLYADVKGGGLTEDQWQDFTLMTHQVNTLLHLVAVRQ